MTVVYLSLATYYRLHVAAAYCIVSKNRVVNVLLYKLLTNFWQTYPFMVPFIYFSGFSYTTMFLLSKDLRNMVLFLM